MDTKKYIPIKEFCTVYHIEDSFVYSLKEVGLLEITTVEETEVVEEEYLRDLEKMVRLHTELDINLEGIDAISHLLVRVTKLQEEVNALRNKLNRFEE